MLRKSGKVVCGSTLVLCLVYVAAAGNNSNNSTVNENGISQQNQTENRRQEALTNRKWIKTIFLEAEKNFDMNDDVNVRCKEDFQRYKAHLQNQTVWAVRMYESSEWPYVGMFSGTVDRLGDYRECLAVSTRQIQGQYCLVEAAYDFPRKPTSIYGNSVYYLPNEEASVWDTLEMYQRNPIRIHRQKLSWAICIPSSCSNSDLEKTLNQLLQPLFRENEMNITAYVDPLLCSIREPPALPFGFYAVSTFIAVIVCLGIASAISDCITHEQEEAEEKKTQNWPTILLKEFSIIRNFKKLTDVSRSGEVTGGHLMKIIYMVLIIYGHRLLYVSQVPMFSVEEYEITVFPKSVKLVNLTVVDAFFFLSGFLTVHYGFKSMKKLGGAYAVLSIITRWMRMVPLLCTSHLFIIYVLPYLSDGPLWNQRLHIESENCKASFWANFFSVSNFVNADKPCLVVSWYTSVDIQLTIIGSILLLITTRHEKLGLSFTFILFVAANVVTFVIVYLYHYNGLMLTHYNFVRQLWKQEEFQYFYTAVYSRIPPYLLGFASAFIVNYMIQRNLKFSAGQKVLLAVGGFAIKILVMIYAFRFYKLEHPYNVVENGIYAGASRWLTVLFDCFLFTIHLTSDFGVGAFDKLVKWKGLIPIGRLTYSVYIVNAIIILYHTAGQQSVFDSHAWINEIWWATADVVFCYIFGMLLNIFFEAPLTSISKKLIGSLFSLLNPKQVASMKKSALVTLKNVNGTNGGSNIVNGNINRLNGEEK